MSRDPLLIFLVAGEPSGDVLGGRLMAALQRATGDNVRFIGVGGPEMQKRGLQSLFPMAELSVMGIVEILPHARKLFARMRETAAAIDAAKPDAVVTIDAPAFAHGVAKRIKLNVSREFTMSRLSFGPGGPGGCISSGGIFIIFWRCFPSSRNGLHDTIWIAGLSGTPLSRVK